MNHLHRSKHLGCLPRGTSDKEQPACQCRRHKRSWLGRSAGGGHSNPLQYSCLENSMDRGAWQATVHRVAESQTQLKELCTCMHTNIWSNIFPPYFSCLLLLILIVFSLELFTLTILRSKKKKVQK